MNKKEYLDTLGKALGAMPYKDVNEILYEIGAHFSEGSLVRDSIGNGHMLRMVEAYLGKCGKENG